MSEDALQAINMYDDAAYKDLLDEANRDDRIGNQTLLITEVVNDHWDDGQERTKAKGVLTTAGNAKADVTMSDPPTAEEIVANKATWDRKKKFGVASSITLASSLAKHYGKTRTQLRQGESYRVKIVKTKKDESSGKGGFLRVVAFLPQEGAESNGSSAGGPGF